MKIKIALLALVFLAFSASAQNVRYFIGQAKSPDGRVGQVAIEENDDTNVITVKVLNTSGVLIHGRGGSMNHGMTRFAYTGTDGRRMMLSWFGAFPERWTGKTRLQDGTLVRLHAIRVFGPPDGASL